jgi:putative glutamine amidotransferase
MRRPLIAVTGPDKKLKFGWWATRFMLWLNGASSCYITPANPQLLAEIDGVIIGGGDDIDPQHYGGVGVEGKDEECSATYDLARDKLEIAMIKAALQADVPMLGICRGAQLINVVLGGSLYQDIRPMRVMTSNQNSAFVVKDALIKDNSILKHIFNTSTIKINSLHSQSVNRIAKGLIASAYDKDGFLQAFENEHKNFLIGVQWHPEYLPYQSQQRKLFAAIVAAVKRQDNKLTPKCFDKIYYE